MSLALTFDESMRRKLYYGVAAVYEGSMGREVSKLVRSHRLPGQTAFHTKNESDSRRRAFIDACVRLGVVRLWVYVAPFPATEARRAIITALVDDAVKNRAGRLVLERGDPGRDRADRQEIERVLRLADVDLAYSHEAPGTYEGLEIADVGAWAYGAGGLWLRRVEPMVESVREVDP